MRVPPFRCINLSTSISSVDHSHPSKVSWYPALYILWNPKTLDNVGEYPRATSDSFKSAREVIPPPIPPLSPTLLLLHQFSVLFIVRSFDSSNRFTSMALDPSTSRPRRASSLRSESTVMPLGPPVPTRMLSTFGLRRTAIMSSFSSSADSCSLFECGESRMSSARSKKYAVQYSFLVHTVRAHRYCVREQEKCF